VASRHAPIPGLPQPPEPSPVDLHTHTSRSDGVLTPAELVAAADAAHVRVLAITDHDTLAAFRELRGSVARLAPGLELIPGVEINAVTTETAGLWEGELHILGYGMDPDDDAFEELLSRQREARRRRFERAVSLLRDLGLGVDAELSGLDRRDDEALGRPTLARALIAAGHATSIEDAFERILGQSRPGYVAREGVGPAEAIGAIGAAGGIPVLAHFREAAARRDVVAGLVARGLRGLEVHYRGFSPGTTTSVGAVADELGLLRTGGSDYHGDEETYAAAHAELWVPPEVGETLRATLAA
jgi:predicted metal-dependent phosphoesterase TrpH